MIRRYLWLLTHKIKGEGKGYAADLTYVENCAKQIAKFSKSDKIVVKNQLLQ